MAKLVYLLLIVAFATIITAMPADDDKKTGAAKDAVKDADKDAQKGADAAKGAAKDAAGDAKDAAGDAKDAAGDAKDNAKKAGGILSGVGKAVHKVEEDFEKTGKDMVSGIMSFFNF